MALTDGAPTTERVAVLEHRADQTDRAIQEIRGFASEIRDSNAQLVKVVTNQEHFERRIGGLEKRFEDEREKRIAQHSETREWAKEEHGQLSANTAWREWSGRIFLALIGAGLALLGALATSLIGA